MAIDLSVRMSEDEKFGSFSGHPADEKFKLDFKLVSRKEDVFGKLIALTFKASEARKSSDGVVLSN